MYLISWEFSNLRRLRPQPLRLVLLAQELDLAKATATVIFVSALLVFIIKSMVPFLLITYAVASFLFVLVEVFFIMAENAVLFFSLTVFYFIRTMVMSCNSSLTELCRVRLMVLHPSYCIILVTPNVNIKIWYACKV